MASTTAGQQQQPVLIRGFDVGINPSMLSNMGMMQYAGGQQENGNGGGVTDMQHTLFSSNGNHNRHSSQSSSSSIAHAHPHGRMSTGGISTEDLVDGLQQSMASMDPAASSHHSHQQYRQAQGRPRSSSSSSSHHGNPQAGSSSTTRPFESARSPAFAWHHGYRPGSSGQNSSSNAAYSLPPDLTRHVSSPSSFLAAAAAAHHPAASQQQQQQQQQSFFDQSSLDTPRSPLDLFHLGNAASNSNSTSSINSTAASGNLYPFAYANNTSNSTDNLASFQRHQAHAQSNSYSSAFSPSSFLVNGLTSPASSDPSQTFPIHQSLTQQQRQYQEQLQLQQQQVQSHQSSQHTRSPPLYDANTNEAGLNANNKRPGSTDSGAAERANAARGNSDSPVEEANSKGQARGRSQGRTPSSGKAPSTARKSRSRTRRPSYSRTISPAGSIKLNGTAGSISPGSTSGGTSTQQQLSNTSTNNASGNTATNGNSQNQHQKYANPYAPQLSPYMPGYPSLPNGNVDAALASKPGTSFEQHAYGASAPTLSSAGFNFMRLQEQQALAHAQARAQAQTAAMAIQRPGSANAAVNTFELLNSQGGEVPQRRASDASTFAPSSSGTIGPNNNSSGTSTMNNMDLLNNPSAFTGPLPLPHQEGFRSFGTLPDYLNSLNGLDGQNEGNQGENDIDSTTRGRQPPDDKRRKRRESHNAVERRRRDNINDRITELASLIPEVLLDTGSTGGGGKITSRSTSRNGRGGDNDDSPDRRGDSPSSTAAFPSNLSSNAQFTPAQLAQQAASNRPNKGVILAKSVDYVRYLQQLVQMQGERNRELEIRVRMYESHAFTFGGGGGGGGMPSLPNANNMVINTNQLPLGFSGAVNSNGLVGSGPLGSPGIPLNGAAGSMRSLPPLEESESTMDEGTGLSHKRDQFTARRSASRNSMNANELAATAGMGSSKSIAVPAAATAREIASPRQDILTTQDWIDNGFAEMTSGSGLAGGSSSHGSGMMNGHASPPSSALMLDQHQMTFEDLLRVGRSNRVVSDSQDSLASESPMPSGGKMEEDDENALGMRT